MTVQRLTLAGWLAITYAVLAIQFFALFELKSTSTLMSIFNIE